ncbi:MAG: hypothetical protein F6K42_21310 [Leptolyngbya sp. SIO1D8]|nr:hypothetical protein [Leptolyngbya sp. SIO1D8]
MTESTNISGVYQARVEFHLPGGISWVVLSDFPGFGDFRWEVDTDEIPFQLRPLGSRFRVQHEYRDQTHRFTILTES